MIGVVNCISKCDCCLLLVYASEVGATVIIVLFLKYLLSLPKKLGILSHCLDCFLLLLGLHPGIRRERRG